MNALILGGTGFVGSKLKYTLELSGYNVTTASLHGDIVVDLTKKSNIEKAFDGLKFDVIIDATVAYSDLYSVSMRNPQITANIMEYFCDFKGIFIFISSFSALDENKFTNAYNHSKYLCEQIIEFFTVKYNLNTLIIRFGQIIDHQLGSINSQKGFHYIVDAIINNREVNVFALNDKPRSYISVENVCKIVAFALENNATGVHNIALEPAYTLTELVELLTDNFPNFAGTVNITNKEALNYFIPESSPIFDGIVKNMDMKIYIINFLNN